MRQESSGWKTVAGVFAAAMAFVALTAGAATAQKIEIKEGAVDLVKVPGVKLFLVKDNKIVNAKTTENPDEIIVSGKVFGATQILCWDDKKVETALDIVVIPRYWDTLEGLLRDYPQVKREICGENIILSGKVRAGEALKKIAIAKALDPTRIIDNVSLSTENLGQKVQDFLKEKGYDTVEVKIVENTLFLSGEVSDNEKKDLLLSVIKSLAEPYGCQLNTSGLVVGELSKLLVDIQFLEVETTKERNRGVTMDSPMRWTTSVGHIADAIGGSIGGLRNDWESIGISGYINALKKNSMAKTVYATTLSTNSGEKATFQQGGTFHRSVYSEYSTGIHEIPYGFMIETTPRLLNRQTLETQVKVQLSVPTPITNELEASTLDIKQYSTSSKYNTRPGESIALSGLDQMVDARTKQAFPLLNYLPWVGEYTGNAIDKGETKKILLVINVDLNKPADQVKLDKRVHELKDKDVDPEMP